MVFQAVMGLVPLTPMLLKGQLCSVMLSMCVYILCVRSFLHIYVCIKKASERRYLGVSRIIYECHDYG